MRDETKNDFAKINEDIRHIRTLAEGAMPPNYVDTWLAKPLPSLQGETSLAVIRRGETDRIVTLFYDVAYGVS